MSFQENKEALYSKWGNSRGLSQPRIANIHGLKEVKEGGEVEMEGNQQGGPENGKREIPEHLTNLFDKSKGELNEQEQTQLSELLCEFEDVFAKSEFDLIQSSMGLILGPIAQLSKESGVPH